MDPPPVAAALVSSVILLEYNLLLTVPTFLTEDKYGPLPQFLPLFLLHPKHYPPSINTLESSIASTSRHVGH